MAETVMLEVVAGPHRGWVFLLPRRTRCTIGRAADCYIRLHGNERDDVISRHHCVLIVDQDQVSLTDLGSLNGTKVNGTLVQPLPGAHVPRLMKNLSQKTVQLNHDDIIEIGESILRVSIVLDDWEKQIPEQRFVVAICALLIIFMKNPH